MKREGDSVVGWHSDYITVTPYTCNSLATCRGVLYT